MSATKELQLDKVGVTTFSYRARSTLRQTDSVKLGDGPSEDAHQSYGTVSIDTVR